MMDALIDGIKVAVLGIVVTFAMLFLIIGFIKILNPIISLSVKLGNGIKSFSSKIFRGKKQDVQPEVEITRATESEEPIANNGISGEVVAAIVAAITCCRAAESSPGGFIVRNIKRNTPSKWRNQ